MDGNMLLLGGVASVAAALSIAVAAVAPTRTGRQQVSRSLAALQGGGGPSSTVGGPSFAQRVLVPALEQLGEAGHRLSPRGAVERLQRQLDVAGNPQPWTVERVLAVKVAGMLLLALLTSWFCSVSEAGLRTLLLTAGAAAAGFFLPDLLVYNAGTKRQEVMQKDLADALDLLTISVESGLGFDAALVQVARSSEGPLAGEFFRTLQEMQIGKSRMDALRALGERTTVADLRIFTSAIVQADGLGIPIARVLREQSKEMRLKRRQRAEEKAMKVPVKVLFPTVVFILPVIFVVILGPAAILISRSL